MFIALGITAKSEHCDQTIRVVFVSLLAIMTALYGANYTNAFIPTNLEVDDAVRASFPAFYAELFDATVERMQRRVVITEYAWQTTGCDPCPVPPLRASRSTRRAA